MQDFRYAVRMLRRNPGFTAVAVLSLALGIGANTAIFTLIESTLLRPIPVKHPEGLRLLTWHEQRGGWVAPNLGYRSPTFGTIYEQRDAPDGGILHTEFTPPLYREFAREFTKNQRVFASLFAFKELGRVTAVVDGNAEPVNCFLVSGDFYRGLEVAPAIGRPIGGADDVRNEASQVALISYEFWTRRFARSASVIGKVIRLNGVSVTIIGVNPESFTGIEPGANFEIWAPLSLPPAVYGHLQQGADLLAQTEQSFLDQDKLWTLPMMGRLQPGVSDAAAQSALDAQFQAYVDANPGPLASFLKTPEKRPRLILQSGARGLDYLTARYDRLLFAVLSLAGLVLLIACANVANLLLAKSAARRREIGLRRALGAGRWRIARQLLVEGLLLAAMAGAAGLILAYWTRRGIPALLTTPWRPSPFDPVFDPRVLLASIAITVFTGVLFSLAPMWQSRRVEGALPRLRAGRLLVVLQAAVSVLLLAGAVLFVRTFVNLKDRPLGFEPEGVVLFTMDPPQRAYSAPQMAGLIEQMQERFRGIRGVQSVSFSAGRAGTRLSGDNLNAYVRATDVGEDFFESLGIRILEGRAIDGRDKSSGVRAVVVNEEFALHFFPGESPVGKTFHTARNETYQIAGVCANWRSDQLREPARPAFYGAWMQDPQISSVDFELKIASAQDEVIRQVKDAVRSIDSNLAIADVRTELEQIENAVAQERLLASLAVLFGGLALLLAAIGMYGVLAYAVTRRTHEIGIRMALGARPEGVAWMVLRDAMLLAGGGIAIALPAILAASRMMDHFLAPGWQSRFTYGVDPSGLSTLAIPALALATTALLAGYLPARRASRVDPMTALRHE